MARASREAFFARRPARLRVAPAEVRSVMRKVKLFKSIYQDNFVLVLLPEKLDQLDRRMAISGLLAENVAVILK